MGGLCARRHHVSLAGGVLEHHLRAVAAAVAVAGLRPHPGRRDARSSSGLRSGTGLEEKTGKWSSQRRPSSSQSAVFRSAARVQAPAAEVPPLL